LRPRQTIALTRATEDAERSAARLLELGYESFVAPATMVLATQAGIPRCDYDAVVATSAKAFDLLSPSSRDAILSLPLFVVGAQTALAAVAQELEVEASAKDAAALAESLRARLTPGSRVLYLAGRDRKSDLESALAADGHRVTPIEVYVAEARRAWSFGEARAVANCDAALHYSARSAEITLRLADGAGTAERFRALLHVCISENAASPLRSSGATRVRSAMNPDENALFDALARAFSAGD
jgi:uroporphyrinogen-III synthase